VVLGRSPELLAMGRPVQWAAPPWELARGPEGWRYAVRDAQGGTVGAIECALEAQASTYRLACSRQQSVSERDAASGVDDGQDVVESLIAEWRRGSLELASVDRQRETSTGWHGYSAVPLGQEFRITLVEGEGLTRMLRLPVPEPAPSPLLGGLPLPGRARLLAMRQPPTVVEADEWPWRFSALPFQAYYGAQVAVLDPDPPEGGDPTLVRTFAAIRGAEPVSTPAGTFVAWRVEVGPDRVAWYDAEEPHTLVAYEDGSERWVLTSTH
jgi:hypothetical protein